MFVEEQNSLTMPYLESCAHRSTIKEQLTANMDYEKFGCPFKRGSKYYFYRNSGLQNQSVLYQQDTLDSEPTVFFDPNTLSDDGTVSLRNTAFSKDGAFFAYGLSHSGSDWVEIFIKDLVKNQDLPDKVERCKFTSISWTHDNRGFFYAQYPKHQGEGKGTEVDSHENHSLYYHKLMSDQKEDKLVVEFAQNPKWVVSSCVSDDGRYLNVFPSEGCQDNQWFVCDLLDSDLINGDQLKLKPIYDKFGAQFEYVTNNGNFFYARTNLDAKNYRIVKIDLDKPDPKHWTDVIPSHDEDVLSEAEAFTCDGKDYILVNYLRKVVYYLELHELEGKLVKRFNTSMGTISKSAGRREDNEIFFHFTSFLTPGITYHFDLRTLEEEPKILRQTKPKNFNPDEFIINQVFYESKDGTKVPMFLVHNKDFALDSSNPCLLYGYGGFNIQITSTFNINRLIWLKNFNGLFAVANIRGGGELGQNWHDSGRLLNKQNCFDDFVSAAEYLIKNKYTSSEKLAIEGGSNGGLLVSAVSNQRPDLFGATLAHVGVLDMLRFHTFTIGHAWTSDYGSPDDKEHFDNIIKYSPYHNIPDTDKYPAMLLLTADHDDRVVPAHSLKFIAELQYRLGERINNTPLLIRVDTKSGHGAGKPVTKTIDEYVDIYCFLLNALKLQFKP